MPTAESRLLELGLELPPAPKPLAVYKPMVVAAGLAYVSGHGPVNVDGSLIRGRVGADLSLQDGYAAAAQVGLAILATLRRELGSLNRVKRVVKLLGMVNSPPDFLDHPKVINGCSELFARVWGPAAGIGARSAVGMGALPGNIAVEIEAIFELDARPVLDIDWTRDVDLSQVASPALLLGKEAIQENLRRMVAVAGEVSRLRPHVKTHKQPWLVKEQLALGISKYKCATIAEAEMCARAGATDILLALQPVGPNVARLLNLQRAFPAVAFSTIADDAGALEAMQSDAAAAGATIEVLIDLDIGQHRTGIRPGPAAIALYRQLAAATALRPGGLHAYDGHLHLADFIELTAACDKAFAAVTKLRETLVGQGLPVPRVVVGGTPSFPVHAARTDVELSPGTLVLWDAGYATKCPFLNFKVAATLLTRVVSKPGENRLCLDLGHKAVGSEMPHPRVIFPDLPDAVALVHSEEHLVIETAEAERFAVGDMLIGVPWHICPTVALHAEAVVIESGRVVERQAIEARARKVTV
ncbi:Atu1372/SO_1960 family protein [Humisphaera borealis]|uniref:Alanine racemase n=1 Tax=Humisphaera borealis TaxID=2807512 RepID=A0A7M2WWA3_9BACT|nr:Atu1372/SO_1960 family protein [Humisphaera borealis]QOV89746.1 alanine racemase [Humisphaera borealis]